MKGFCTDVDGDGPMCHRGRPPRTALGQSNMRGTNYNLCDIDSDDGEGREGRSLW